MAPLLASSPPAATDPKQASSSTYESVQDYYIKVLAGSPQDKCLQRTDVAVSQQSQRAGLSQKLLQGTSCIRGERAVRVRP